MALWKRSGPTPADPAWAELLSQACTTLARLRSARFIGETDFADWPAPSISVGTKDFVEGTALHVRTVGTVTSESYLAPDVAYLRLDPETEAAVGKSWVVRAHPTSDFEAVIGPGMAVYAAATASAANVVVLDPETIDGAVLTPIRVDVRPEAKPRLKQAIELAAHFRGYRAEQVHVVFSFDETGALRRYRIAWPSIFVPARPGGEGAPGSMTREYFDFDGIEPIVLPNLADVLWQPRLPANLDLHPVVART